MSDFSGLHSYQFFSLAGFSRINELSFYTAPTRCILWTLKNTHMKHLTVRFSLAAELALCRDHYIFTSCHCYHGKESKSSVYRKLLCSHFPVLPSHLTVAMETCRTSMTALCVRHAGRGDVMCFSPPLWLSLCCVRGSRFSITDPLARLNNGTCRGMCKHTEHKVSARWEIPASGVCGIYQQWGANCLMPLKSPSNCPTSPRRAHTC